MSAGMIAVFEQMVGARRGNPFDREKRLVMRAMQ
jgi:hypothetical protein